ncbi:MAG: Gfo/Idh/MocA family oxidoreductase [Pirellulales bacterium]|nr:Gfo/Idh/MocA family oxidoreductase [Pirellulales bacterium]
MNLSPEEKKIGKENFNNVVGTTRRDFLKGSALAAVVSGTSLGAAYFGYGKTVDNPVRVGVIGTGDEGCVLIGAINPEFIQVVAIADIRPYNIWRAFHGDHSSDSANAARPGLMHVYGWKTEEEAKKHVKVYPDRYEELLDNAEVEAVIIALPLHLHDVVSIQAMRRGKHVLTEKLMAHSAHQCKEMARVAEDTGLLLATGHQRHYSVLYDNAVDTIKRGLIGDVHYIRAQWHRGNLPGNDSWQPPLPVEMMSEAEYLDGRRAARKENREAEYRGAHVLLEQYFTLQKNINDTKKYSARDREKMAMKLAQYEAQLKDAAINASSYGYQEITLEDGKGTIRSPLEELIRWRLWNRTGGGLMAELGSHQLDAASIFISSQRDDGEKVLPLSVVAVGGRHLFPVDRDCDDHVYCSFEFPGKGYYEDYESKKIADPNKKIVVTYSSINGNGFGGYGEVVYGTKGTMILEREQDVMLFAGSDTTSYVGVKKSDSGPTLDTTESGGGEAAIAQAAAGPVSRGYREEIEHWAWCIRNPGDKDKPNLPRCHPKVALADSVIALTSNIAMDQSCRIDFKPEWFDIHSNETPEGIEPRQAKDIA